jgi:hypothetical protein
MAGSEVQGQNKMNWILVFWFIGVLIFTYAFIRLSFFWRVTTDRDLGACSKQYNDVKRATDRATVIHEVSVMFIGILFLVFGATKSSILSEGFLSGTLKTSLISVAFDYLSNMYYIIKYKLLLAKRELEKEKQEMTSFLRDAHNTFNGLPYYRANMKLLDHVNFTVGKQYIEIALMVFMLAALKFFA